MFKVRRVCGYLHEQKASDTLREERDWGDETVYINATAEVRPAFLCASMNEYGYFAPEINLNKIIQTLDTLMPN